MRRMNFSAAGVNSMDICFVSLIYTAAANRGTSGLMMHVFGIGQIASTLRLVKEANAFGALCRIHLEAASPSRRSLYWDTPR